MQFSPPLQRREPRPREVAEPPSVAAMGTEVRFRGGVWLITEATPLHFRCHGVTVVSLAAQRRVLVLLATNELSLPPSPPPRLPFPRATASPLAASSIHHTNASRTDVSSLRRMRRALLF